MQLSPPTQVVFLVSLILAILALVGRFAHVAYITEYDFWFAIVGYIVLFLGNLLKGL